MNMSICGSRIRLGKMNMLAASNRYRGRRRPAEFMVMAVIRICAELYIVNMASHARNRLVRNRRKPMVVRILAVLCDKRTPYDLVYML